jgi:hypothetical protein
MEPSTEKETLFLGWLAIVLFVVGLLGYPVLLALRADIPATLFLVAAELMALVFGVLGRKSLTGKIAIGGVCLLLVWSSATYAFYYSARVREEQRAHDARDEHRR